MRPKANRRLVILIFFLIGHSVAVRLAAYNAPPPPPAPAKKDAKKIGAAPKPNPVKSPAAKSPTPAKGKPPNASKPAPAKKPTTTKKPNTKTTAKPNPKTKPTNKKPGKPASHGVKIKLTVNTNGSKHLKPGQLKNGTHPVNGTNSTRKFVVVDNDKARHQTLVKKIKTLEATLDSAEKKLMTLTDTSFTRTIQYQLASLLGKLQYNGDVKIKIKRDPPKDPTDFRGEMKRKKAYDKKVRQKLNFIIEEGNKPVPRKTFSLEQQVKKDSQLNVVFAKPLSGSSGTPPSPTTAGPPAPLLKKTASHPPALTKKRRGRPIKRVNRKGLPDGPIFDHLKKKTIGEIAITN